MAGSAPEVEAAARAESLTDTPPAEPPRRGPGRPRKATSTPPAAPKGGSPSSPPGGDARAPRSHKAKPKLAPKLAEFQSLIGMGLCAAGMARGDKRLFYDGSVILANAERLSQALEAAAAEHPPLRRALELLVATTTLGELAGAAAAIAVPILANHGVLPPGAAPLVGAEPPPARPDVPGEVDVEPGHQGPPTGNGAVDLAGFRAAAERPSGP